MDGAVSIGVTAVLMLVSIFVALLGAEFLDRLRKRKGQ
jgi:hypothetical protein